MRGFFIVACLACLPLSGGCFFGGPQKRGNTQDRLEVDTDAALRLLDSADTAAALPALAGLAENAGRADELGLRIQALLLSARALESEAELYPQDKAAALRRAALRHADAALEEAADWRRFEPENTEGTLLEFDARILRAGLRREPPEEMKPLLAMAVAEAVSRKDAARETAWRMALCGAQLDGGTPDEARRTLAEAKASFAKIARAAKENDPATESLSLALTEMEGDVALHGGQNNAAETFYKKALDGARPFRRRGDVRRILLKLSRAANQTGDADRAAWYSRRAAGVAAQNPNATGGR